MSASVKDMELEIWGAGLVFICDREFSILKNGAIVFESGLDSKLESRLDSKLDSENATILEVGDFALLCEKYPHAKAHFYPNGVLLPALINAHIHFEFGANLSSFEYGDFGVWLDSIMNNRDHIINNADSEADFKANSESSKALNPLAQGILEQLQSGVGSVGAISSYGGDMLPLAKSPLRVVFYNEAIGSNPSAIDFLYGNLLERFKQSQALKSATFTPALALHSPYSLHPIMAQKIIALAKEAQIPLCAHFLESKHEREWLTQSTGYFKGFFQKLASIKEPKAFYTPQSFLEQLLPLRQSPLYLTHCLEIDECEADMLRDLDAVITSCPRSNRLLNNTYLKRDLALKRGIPIAFGTDGKSSNYNVSLLDELRAALFAYEKCEIHALARELLLGATLHGARALGLSNGTLAAGKCVDFALFDFSAPLDSEFSESSPHEGEDKAQATLSRTPLHFLLNAKAPLVLYINAKGVISPHTKGFK